MVCPRCFAGIIVVLGLVVGLSKGDVPPAPSTTNPAGATWQIVAKPAAETANRKGGDGSALEWSEPVTVEIAGDK